MGICGSARVQPDEQPSPSLTPSPAMSLGKAGTVRSEQDGTGTETRAIGAVREQSGLHSARSTSAVKSLRARQGEPHRNSKLHERRDPNLVSPSGRAPHVRGQSAAEAGMGSARGAAAAAALHAAQAPASPGHGSSFEPHPLHEHKTESGRGSGTSLALRQQAHRSSFGAGATARQLSSDDSLSRLLPMTRPVSPTDRDMESRVNMRKTLNLRRRLTAGAGNGVLGAISSGGGPAPGLARTQTGGAVVQRSSGSSTPLSPTNWALQRLRVGSGGGGASSPGSPNGRGSGVIGGTPPHSPKLSLPLDAELTAALAPGANFPKTGSMSLRKSMSKQRILAMTGHLRDPSVTSPTSGSLLPPAGKDATLRPSLRRNPNPRHMTFTATSQVHVRDLIAAKQKEAEAGAGSTQPQQQSQDGQKPQEPQHFPRNSIGGADVLSYVRVAPSTLAPGAMSVTRRRRLTANGPFRTPHGVAAQPVRPQGKREASKEDSAGSSGPQFAIDVTPAEGDTKAPQPPNEAKPEARRPRFLKRGKRRALIIDGIPVSQRLTSIALYRVGYSTDGCPDARTAVEMAVSGAYEVIVIDLLGLGDTGLDIAHAIDAGLAENPIHDGPPLLIAIANQADAASLTAYQAAGFHACIEKGAVLGPALLEVVTALRENPNFVFINSNFMRIQAVRIDADIDVRQPITVTPPQAPSPAAAAAPPSSIEGGNAGAGAASALLDPEEVRRKHARWLRHRTQ